jgi:hypothetical protein
MGCHVWGNSASLFDIFRNTMDSSQVMADSKEMSAMLLGF